MAQNITKEIEMLLSRMAVALENISANSTAVTEATPPDTASHAFIWQAQDMRFQPCREGQSHSAGAAKGD